jgi:ABC-type branched-subunit amino acid transport system ATPase component
VPAAEVTFGSRPSGPAGLRELSLALEPGTATAILGPNGAGKSTLLHLALGWLRARSGPTRRPGHKLSGARLPAGAVSDPITTLDGTTIVRVVERHDVTPGEAAEGRESLRLEMLQDRRGQFFTAFMMKARLRMKIELNRQAIDQVTS